MNISATDTVLGSTQQLTQSGNLYSDLWRTWRRDCSYKWFTCQFGLIHRLHWSRTSSWHHCSRTFWKGNWTHISTHCSCLGSPRVGWKQRIDRDGGCWSRHGCSSYCFCLRRNCRSTLHYDSPIDRPRKCLWRISQPDGQSVQATGLTHRRPTRQRNSHWTVAQPTRGRQVQSHIEGCSVGCKSYQHWILVVV